MIQTEHTQSSYFSFKFKLWFDLNPSVFSANIFLFDIRGNAFHSINLLKYQILLIRHTLVSQGGHLSYWSKPSVILSFIPEECDMSTFACIMFFSLVFALSSTVIAKPDMCVDICVWAECAPRSHSLTFSSLFFLPSLFFVTVVWHSLSVSTWKHLSDVCVCVCVCVRREYFCRRTHTHTHTVISMTYQHTHTHSIHLKHMLAHIYCACACESVSAICPDIFAT